MLSAGCYLRLHATYSPFPEAENDSSVGIWCCNDVGGCAVLRNSAKRSPLRLSISALKYMNVFCARSLYKIRAGVEVRAGMP